jgi:hypothetical protein
MAKWERVNREFDEVTNGQIRNKMRVKWERAKWEDTKINTGNRQ